MIAEDDKLDPQQANSQTKFLESVKNAKEAFINLTIEELKGGDPNCKDIQREKFDRTFNAAFCRPSNLR